MKRPFSRTIMARSKKGSMITFSTVLALVLVILGLAFLAFLMFMGGQSETKNATDAGALNVGQKVLDELSVPLGPAANMQVFADVASDDETGSRAIVGDNKITLRRLNRVWAKAMLIAINARAAGGNAGSGNGNASSALAGATTLSNAIHSKLTNSHNLLGFFTEFASQNSVRMLGPAAKVDFLASTGWQTSLMEREKESNITLAGTPSNGFYLPPGYTMDNSYTTQTTRSSQTADAGNKWFLKGYKALAVGDKTFWQVPFLYNEKPHLVSSSVFDANKKSVKPLNWAGAVPNAFSVHGKALQAGSVGEQARSWVLSNPRQTYKMSMPQSYLHIKIEEPHSEWYFFPVGPPIKFGANQNYGFTPTTQTQGMPFGGVLCSSVTGNSVLVGLDVVGRNVDQLIFGIPQGNSQDLEKQLTARVNEMVSKVGVTKSTSDMHSCLGNPANIAFLVAGQRDFYVYSPDGESITCKPKALAIAQAPWLATKINNSADGNESTSIPEATQYFGGAHMPTVVPLPLCVMSVQLGWSNWKKQVWWEPGTGYNGNLGRVRVKRWTNVNSLGVCVPI